MLPPHAWVSCPAQGTEICGFITPGKTFLDSRYDTYIAAEAHYRPPLPDMYSAVIDLTNTARYYNGRALGACYHKIKCKGHNQCPSPRAVKAFIDTVVAAPGLVYVHCTYGFNRTGYLICCYLVECRKMSVHDAIRLFAEARPPGMYKADYIKTLCVKYNARVLAVPSNLPSWLPEQVVVTHTASGPKAARHVLRCISVEDPVLAAEIVRVVATTVGYPYTDQFAGCMPVSMSKHNYASILCLKDDARATWKADGVRYMMYIDGKDRVYVIDRCAHVSRLTADVFVGPDGMHLVDTLVDCEYTSNGTMYIFDAVYVRGVYVCDAPLDSRLASVQCVAQAHRGPMSVRVKCSVGIGDFELLYSTYADRSDCDGFIFQSNSRPYYGGRDVQIIKYKPVHKNTVDFMLVPSDAQCAGLYLHNDTTPFAQVSAWDPAMAGRVVECAYVNGTWSVLRVRADKSQANTRVTALRVYESIIHPVDFDLFRETISLAMLF